MAIILLATVLLCSNMSAAKDLSDIKLNLQTTVILSALAIFLACYLSRPNKEKGVFLRTGFMELILISVNILKLQGSIQLTTKKILRILK